MLTWNSGVEGLILNILLVRTHKISWSVCLANFATTHLDRTSLLFVMCANTLRLQAQTLNSEMFNSINKIIKYAILMPQQDTGNLQISNLAAFGLWKVVGHPNIKSPADICQSHACMGTNMLHAWHHIIVKWRSQSIRTQNLWHPIWTSMSWLQFRCCEAVEDILFAGHHKIQCNQHCMDGWP